MENLELFADQDQERKEHANALSVWRASLRLQIWYRKEHGKPMECDCWTSKLHASNLNRVGGMMGVW